MPDETEKKTSPESPPSKPAPQESPPSKPTAPEDSINKEEKPKLEPPSEPPRKPIISKPREVIEGFAEKPPKKKLRDEED